MGKLLREMPVRHAVHWATLTLGVMTVALATGLDVGTLTNPGPGFWPTMGGVLMSGSSVWLIVTEKSDEEYEKIDSGIRDLCIAAIIVVAGAAIFGFLGITASIAVFTFAWLALIDRSDIVQNTILSVCISLGMFLFFAKALGIPMPDDIIMNQIGL